MNFYKEKTDDILREEAEETMFIRLGGGGTCNDVY